MSTVTADRLRHLLTYDEASGIFRWRISTSQRAPVGAIAGCKHKRDGRIYISVDGRLYKAHRLAWLYVHGVWPAQGIDHIDGNPGRNAIANLRAADQRQNLQNVTRPHRDNKIGFLGVCRRGKRFGARLKAGPIVVNSIAFDTPEEAHAAYLEIKSIFHPFYDKGAR